MPNLSDSLVGNLDLSRYSPVSASEAIPPTPSPGVEPGRSGFMRCPLPPIFQASPDSLRQFYKGTNVPQARTLTPNTPSQSSSSSSSTSTSTVVVSSGSSGSSTTSAIAATQVVLTTPMLAPGKMFTTTITTSRSFQLLGAASNAAARIELYGSAAAQSQDSSRALDVPPPYGTAQNIICDIALDTAPYTWSFQNRIGSNADSPQTTTAYVTITNIGSAAKAISVNIAYVPLES